MKMAQWAQHAIGACPRRKSSSIRTIPMYITALTCRKLALPAQCSANQLGPEHLQGQWTGPQHGCYAPCASWWSWYGTQWPPGQGLCPLPADEFHQSPASRPTTNTREAAGCLHLRVVIPCSIFFHLQKYAARISCLITQLERTLSILEKPVEYPSAHTLRNTQNIGICLGPKIHSGRLRLAMKTLVTSCGIVDSCISTSWKYNSESHSQWVSHILHIGSTLPASTDTVPLLRCGNNEISTTNGSYIRSEVTSQFHDSGSQVETKIVMFIQTKICIGTNRT